MINGNWFLTEFSIPTITIAYCRNGTEAHGDWCKTRDEIDQWLLTHPSYFVYQKTRVEMDMFYEQYESYET